MWPDQIAAGASAIYGQLDKFATYDLTQMEYTVTAAADLQLRALTPEEQATLAAACLEGRVQQLADGRWCVRKYADRSRPCAYLSHALFTLDWLRWFGEGAI